VLGLLIVVADLRPARIAPRRKASLATVPALLAAMVLPPAWAGLTAGLAALAANLALRRPLRNAVLNAGMVALATTLAGLAMGPQASAAGALPVLRALAGAAVFSAVTMAIAASAGAAFQGAPLRATLAAAFREGWPQALAMGAVAVATGELLLRQPWAAPLPLAFLPLVERLNRTLEAELAARERLDQLLAAQRQFLTDVSHHIGNPLATIRANLSLLGRAPLSSPQHLAHADAVAETARLSDLLRRLRVLAETDEELPMHMADIDLALMAGDLVRAFSGEARARGVDLRCEVAAPTAVRADEDLLRQAAANLVDNAIRYSPDGTSVVLRVGHRRREARLEVIDQGPGIDPQRLPGIFDRFQSGPGGGSGLGLSIARNVVERHGGRIEVEAGRGTGSRFVITLPST
jgi:signal transduction histidine kinase